MLLVTHEGIPIAVLPEFTAPSQDLVCLLGGESFSSVQQLGHRHTENFEEEMNVVGHNHPRPQFIILSIPETERIFNDLCDFRSLEMASSPPLVQVSLQLNSPLTVVFDFQQRFPFGTQLFRERIGESKGDELNQPRFVAVRKITLLVPAQKSMLNILLGEGTRPFAFALHQIPDAGIVGRTWKTLGIHGQVFSCRSIR